MCCSAASGERAGCRARHLPPRHRARGPCALSRNGAPRKEHPTPLLRALFDHQARGWAGLHAPPRWHLKRRSQTGRSPTRRAPGTDPRGAPRTAVSKLSTPDLFALCALVAAAALALRLEPVAVDAGTATRMDIDALVAGSERVVEARVVHGESFEDPLGTAIATDWTLDVERTFVGPDEAALVLRWPGGVLPDGRGMVVPGMPRIAPGERVLLFLAATSGRLEWRMPVGLAQGKLRVVSTLGGERALVSDGAALCLVEPEGEAYIRMPSYSRDYAEVVAQIHAAVARAAGANR